MRYYSISGTAKSKSVDADPKWLDASRIKLFPQGCKHMNPCSTLEDVIILSPPPARELSWVSPLSHTVLSERDLILDMLGPNGMDAVKAASATLMGGGGHNTYLAFVPRHSILVRGQPASTLKGACEKCGHLYYWPRPTNEPDKWYLVRQSLVDEAPVYRGSAAELILREDIFDRAMRLDLKNIRVREMPILNQPLDGLPADLPEYMSPGRQRELGDLLTRDFTEYDRRWAQRMANAPDVEKDRIVEWVPPKRGG